jgi:uncharacterized repeat protein (TIGR01451 family)
MGWGIHRALTLRHLCRAILCALVLQTASDTLLQAKAEQQAERLEPGEAYVTRFSGTRTEGDTTIIDTSGVVGSIVDVRAPGQAPQGHHWLNEPQRLPVTAAEVGQVFGIAFDDANPPNIYLSATSAFGLHRSSDGSEWMSGQWGAGGGPGTIWKLDAANGYKPVVFAHVMLNGTPNSAAALGAIAYDRQHKQLMVSDLETGMIHRLKIEDGSDLGHYDHGMEGRAKFVDATSGAQQSLSAVAFDPMSGARIADCPEGEFTSTPACWNFADFRRRVWGLGLRREENGGERLFYAIWSSQGFGNPDFAKAGADEQRNSVWSIAIAADGDFDRTSVRREYSLPDFFLDPEDIKRAGRSNPVSDIEFPECTADPVMLTAERGGVRNLGLAAANAFAFPNESRVLRFESDSSGVWKPTGRYDIGYYDRKKDKAPYLRANAAGGVDFGFGYKSDWTIDPENRNGWVWMSGDDLCSPFAPCFNPDTGKREDGSEVHGIEGMPQAAFDEVAPAQSTQPYPANGEPYPPKGPQQSWMIDADENVGPDGLVIMAELTKKDATDIGDVEVYEPCQGEPGASELPPPSEAPPVTEPPPDAVPPPVTQAPPGEGPDLEKRKDGPAQCDEGGVCAFTITVTNLGPGVWSGPLMELDTLPPGATLIGFAPQPEWRCNQALGTRFIDCYHDFVALQPGEAVQLTIDLLLPVGLVGLVQNCVEDTFLPSNDPLDPAVILAIERVLNAFGYPVGPIDGILDINTQNAIAMLQADSGLPVTGIPDQTIIQSLFPAGVGGDRNPANDRACHTVDIVPLPPPPPAAQPDIEVRKSQRTAECNPDGLCTFDILFINRGPVPWTGRPEVTDTLPPGANLESSSPPWICSQSGAQVRCQYPLELTLAPGDIRQITITLRMPPNLTPGVQNCVEILWPPGVRDPNPGNDRMCIPVRVAPPQNQDIETQKMLQGSPCTAGQDCQFELWFTNRGPGDWTGKPALIDTLPAGATFKSATAPWACTQTGGDVTCEHPDVTLPAMQSLKVTITLTMPATIPAGAKNCSRVKHPPGYVDPVPGNDEACIGLPPSGPQGPPPPPRTEKCNATVKAGGDAPETIDIDLSGYQGTAKFSWEHFSIKDRMKVTAGGQLIHDTQCVGGSGTKDFPIAGFTSVRVEVLPNCDGTSTGTQWEFKVECPGLQPGQPPPQQPPAGLPDFEMKKSQTTPACTPGGSCSFEIQLINKGPGPWTDRPELKDMLPAGATFESVSPPPWTCTQSGAELRCKHPTDLTMQPGSPVTFTIVAKMPGAIAPGAENCIEIVWGPYRDNNPANDRACTPVQTTPSPPPRTEKCNATVKAGGDAPETIDIDLSGYQGTAKFSWEHFSIKDRMKVTAGGQLIHDTQCVGGSGSKDFPIAGANSVRVEVIPNCDGTSTGTQWEFKVECPTPPLHVEQPEFQPKPPKIITPPLLCPHGTVKQGNTCVELQQPPKVEPPPKAPAPKKPPVVKKTPPGCPSGYVYNRRAHRCVSKKVPPPIRVQPPLPTCPYGTIRLGQLCIRIQIPPPSHGGGGGGGGGGHHHHNY